MTRSAARLVTTLPFTPVITRPLPGTVTPFPNETVDSYISRLASANRTTPHILRTPSHWLRCPLNDLELLELLSGQPRTSLVWALPELRCYEPGIALPPRTPDVITRFACRRCVWQAGGTGTVHVHAPTHYDLVCLRHGIWHSEGVKAIGQQIDLAPVPEVIRAQMLINRLERRHGQRFIAECYRVCERHWAELDRRGLVRNGAVALLKRLPLTDINDLRPLGPHHRFRRVTRFPQLARFTALVASLALRHAANTLGEKAGPTILAEFERTFQLDYRPRSITRPWMETALIHVVVTMADVVRMLRLSETDTSTPSRSI
ncbi:hypothetical protein [Streptomyces corynorhini]|uniref:Uncharacterized protein n=1 Tax=Streptomyces corynorhini TaxID=2282652 RepID=A0A370B4M8_9ACTN|nr:hypothetical protein [Streptomyces corynorhini]RDG35044.1 hypothetical protein DVH02_27415 [Streptomyces corynorhini]